MAKQTFVRNKEHVNIGTIGTLTMVKQPLPLLLQWYWLRKVIAEIKTFDQIDNAPEKKKEVLLLNCSRRI